MCGAVPLTATRRRRGLGVVTASWPGERAQGCTTIRDGRLSAGWLMAGARVVHRRPPQRANRPSTGASQGRQGFLQAGALSQAGGTTTGGRLAQIYQHLLRTEFASFIARYGWRTTHGVALSAGENAPLPYPWWHIGRSSPIGTSRARLVHPAWYILAPPAPTPCRRVVCPLLVLPRRARDVTADGRRGALVLP
jgi:hypothetical protein